LVVILWVSQQRVILAKTKPDHEQTATLRL